LQEELRRKQEQIAKLSSMEQSSDGVRARYDRLVADLLKQQDTLKVKHSELHKRLKEVDVRCFMMLNLSIPILRPSQS